MTVQELMKEIRKIPKSDGNCEVTFKIQISVGNGRITKKIKVTDIELNTETFFGREAYTEVVLV